MAAMFFRGVFSTFMAYSQIGGSAGSASPGPQGQPPGSSGSGGGAVFMPPVPVNSGGQHKGAAGSQLGGFADSGPSTGQRGVANNERG